MREDEKELILGILEFLKMEMKKQGLIFGVILNKVDPNESMLAICKKRVWKK